MFCSDECYDNYEHSHNDSAHPYIDDYEAVRFEYIEWMRRYEEELYKFEPSKKEDLVEGIESAMEEFADYIRLAGCDGIFSMEIFQYLMALERLLDTIINWEPPKSLK